MPKKTLRHAVASGLCCVMVSAGGNAVAQTYPAKPIRWVVPFSPGGATDIVARAVGQKLAESWGQQVIVDNRAGGGGVIGTEIVAKSPPDGYTIGGISLNFTVYPTLYKNIPFQVPGSFTPITLVALIPSVLVVHPSVPVQSVKDLIALAKARPGELGFASGGGVGTGGHVAAELFMKLTDTKMIHVPYKGGGPATIDVIGGHVPVYFATVASIIQMVRAGKVRPVAVTSPKRFYLLPELPTVAEAGVPGFDTQEMQGIVGPAGMPHDITRKLNTEIVRILNLPDIKSRLTDLGAAPVAGSPEQFSAYLDAEIKKWGEVFKGAQSVSF
jgi:tripartite-type tricarboxylate transporter receptor subunit TctC